MQTSFIYVAPELVLTLGTLALLIAGVLKGNRWLSLVSWAGALLCIFSMILVSGFGQDRLTAFNDMFVTDGFARFLKIIILLASAVSILLALPYLHEQKILNFEYPILILLATVGMCAMVSANDLISLYVGLELQSLSLYVLASIRRDDEKSTEAGLKYFVLGALSSGLLLYGASLLYGATGSTNFEAISSAFALGTGSKPSLAALFGLALVLAGLAFKVSAVPFHMWTPDVYEGAPTPVTAFFSAAPKVAAMGLLMRVLFDALPGLRAEWTQIIAFLSIASMVLGSVAAIGQTNIKRLLAYSSIGHVGYAFIGIAAARTESIGAVLFYLASYVIMTLGAFLCVMAMKRGDTQVEDMSELAGLSKTQPLLAMAFATLMFSLAGIPMLLGFFGKLFIFQSAINVGTPLMVTLAVVGALASVIGAYYYLRLIKIMYFDPATQAFKPVRNSVNIILLNSFALAASPLSFLYFMPLMKAARTAASSLVGTQL
jgi:NADH-quinone oxidoreductase subunit N